MCDYSLGGLPNRLAVDGEELVTRRFSTGSIGLASLADVHALEVAAQSAPKKPFWQRFREFLELPKETCSIPAVCVPPGARLVWKEVRPQAQRKWGLKDQEPVTFLQTNQDVDRYRDALQLRNGVQVLLQELPEGARFQITSTGGDYEADFDAPLAVPAGLGSLR